MKNEEYISKIRALELWDNKILDGFEVGTTKGLQEIHYFLFQDIFEFAGKIRALNIGKGNFRFAPVLFLESNLEIIDKMPEDSFEDIVDKYTEMNFAHPFMEGNGRATRIWLDLLLKKNLSLVIDWSKIDRNLYLEAMILSPRSNLELKELLKTALTKDINNRQIFIRGIQASYRYEDLDSYDIENSENDKDLDI